jgi:hypothetical protein
MLGEQVLFHLFQVLQFNTQAAAVEAVLLVV